MMLGRYFARGLAGEIDPKQARHWLNQALANGQAEASHDIAALDRAERIQSAESAEGPPTAHAVGL